jgi:PhzF family phenazine biosynthesis protein
VTRRFDFQQVDVFASAPLKGNALAVVIGADALSDAEMAAFANWTNLAETTFLLAPTDPAADYRVRIFTTERELPFAGHPTIGSAYVWLASGGVPKSAEIVQQCGIGLVRLRRDGDRLAFAAPPLIRSDAVEPALLARVAKGLGVEESAIVASSWLVNGPEWLGVELASRAEVLALRPDKALLAGLDIGVVARCTAADNIDAQFEVRAFPADIASPEDPVTGSLNAGLAQWLLGSGRATSPYLASQGTAIGRAGRVHVEQIGADIWIGGASITVIAGSVTI